MEDQVEPSQQCHGNKDEHARAKRVACYVLLTPPLRMGRDESKEKETTDLRKEINFAFEVFSGKNFTGLVKYIVPIFGQGTCFKAGRFQQGIGSASFHTIAETPIL